MYKFVNLLCALLMSLNLFSNAYANDLEEYQHVSIINLISTPEKYHDKKVYLTGWATFRLENKSICLSKEPGSSKDCVWLNVKFNDLPEEGKGLTGKVIIVRGIYDKKFTGHFGMWSGGINPVKNLELAP